VLYGVTAAALSSNPHSNAKRPGHPGLLKHLREHSRPSERGIFRALGEHAKRILRKRPPAFDAVENDLDLPEDGTGDGTNKKAASERSDGLLSKGAG
jgi:hypothetical protein